VLGHYGQLNNNSELSCESGGTCLNWNDRPVAGFATEGAAAMDGCELGGTCFAQRGNIVSAIDENDCEHNGNFWDVGTTLDAYTCNCQPGWNGTHCEIDIDECASNPCVNGAPCMDEISFYVCLCLGGFTGTECQIDIDECASAPCDRQAPCTDSLNNGSVVPGVYNCACLEGFGGHNCGIDIDECASGACQNGAACYESGGNNPS